jgi:hypothetical protein
LRNDAEENGGYYFLCDPASDLRQRFAEIAAQQPSSASSVALSA